MVPDNLSDGLPAYARFSLLAIVAAIAGVILYALYPLLPASVQALVMVAACLIAMSGNSAPNGEKTLASLLVMYIAVLFRIFVVCVIVWESSRPINTRVDAELRVWFVAACLVAFLPLLDRRVSFRE
jgi:hypothetical protein